MLHGAAAATTGLKSEVLAGGFYAQSRFFFDGNSASTLIAIFIAKTLIGDRFTGKSAFYKDHFAITVRNASSILIKRFNINRKLFKYFRGSCHWKYPSKRSAWFIPYRKNVSRR